MLRCTLCKIDKTSSEFSPAKQNSSGFSSHCKECRNAKRRDGTTYKSARNHYLKYRYGITQADYEAMLKVQDGRCALCKEVPPSRGMGRGKRIYATLMIDHCHKTGRIRDLLCTQCNVAIGYFGENQDRLRLAISYLQKHTT